MNSLWSTQSRPKNKVGYNRIKCLLNNRGIVMTIEEKAKEYSSDTFGTPFGDDIAMAFSEGAKWMLEKAVQRFANEVSEFDTLLYLIDKTSEGLINKENTVEKFRKALEE